jgi:L-asparaginase/Glu-tRNA(Gln) amidotransferase subunit D
VLTGALQPAAFKSSDAIFNIGCAIGALQSAPPGVYIAMNGRLFDVDNVRKNVERESLRDATRSVNGAHPDAAVTAPDEACAALAITVEQVRQRGQEHQRADHVPEEHEREHQPHVGLELDR